MIIEIQIAIVGAASALLGSILGGAISYLTARRIRALEWQYQIAERDIQARSTLYSEFLAEIGKLSMGAIDGKKLSGTNWVQLHALSGRIRIVSSPEVFEAAQKVIPYLIELYTNDQKHKTTEGEQAAKAALNPFLIACRREIEGIKMKA